MKKLIVLFAVAVMALPQLAHAIAMKTNIADSFPSFGRSVRALGMGNAMLSAKGIDQNAMFYNPSAIADYEGEVTYYTGLIPPAFEFNYSAIALTKDLFNLKDDLDKATTASAKTNVFRNFVDKHVGSSYDLDVRLPLFGAYNRYFSVALLSDNRMGISFRNRAFPNYEIRATSISGVGLGSAYALFEDTLEIGAMAKVLYGIENEQIITIADILSGNMDNFKWKYWKRGMGVGFDVGAKYQVPDFGQDWIDTLRPAVAVTYQDIGNTKFRWMKKNGAPSRLDQSVSAGFSLNPVFGAVETSLNVDFRQLNLKQEFILKLNAGIEARFPERYGMKPSLRAGCNQGYPTVGGGIQIGFFNWDVAFYGKELGESTREKGAYRLASEWSYRF